MKTNQSFEYTGSDQYDINNVILGDNAIVLFDSLTGVGGIDYMPYNGSMVTVKAGDPSTDYRNLSPTLNNKLKYLVSDIEYTESDKSTILALSTDIPVTLSGGIYEGTFLFENPNNYEYLYLLWDYTDSADGGTISYRGQASDRYINFDLGTGIGITGINYNAINQPVRFQIKWGDTVVSDSKYVGLNTLSNYDDLIANGVSPEDIGLQFPYDGTVNNGMGSLKFIKFLSGGDYDKASIIVSSPLVDSVWIINTIKTYLNEFYIDIADGVESDVCAQCPTELYYHNGSNLLPTSGDIIYTIADGSVVYNGNNTLHIVDSVYCSHPSTYLLIDENGLVSSVSNCNCYEPAPPFIYQEDIFFNIGNPVYVSLSSTGNPTSWTIISTCLSYVLDGGSSSTLFEFTDCDGNLVETTVSANVQRTVCSTSIPVITRGFGSVTANGVCDTNIFPVGLSFNNGVLNGSVNEATSFSFLVKASNCFGDGYRTINVFIGQESNLNPVLIDVEQFKDLQSDCCSITASFTLLYFSGKSSIPNVGDRIFMDHEGNNILSGGNRWYYIDKSDYVIKVDSNGYVNQTYVCPGSTTTTTTTTTTTLPIGDYYNASLCSDSTVSVVLLDTTSTTIIAGDIVRSEDGNCWRVTGTASASFPYYFMYDPVTIYADCTTCTGTTTTTTTTTTTLSPTITPFNINTHGNSSDYTCCNAGGEDMITLYHSGPDYTPAINDFVYTDSMGAHLFNGGFMWYWVDSNYAINIADTGQVLRSNDCIVVTTTTSTTTVPTYYYNAEMCNNPGPVYLLSYNNFTEIEIGTIVKDSMGNCYELLSSASPGSPDGEIYFQFNNCFDCVGTTTTTTTSTTTTTTTSTTTTSTTTISPKFQVLCKDSSFALVCGADINTFYVDGPLGEIGYNIYSNEFSSDLAPANYYMKYDVSTAYEWDGSAWTGNFKNC